MLSPMGKQRMRVVINEAGAVPSNALYGLYFEDPGIAHAVGHWLAGERGKYSLRTCSSLRGWSVQARAERCGEDRDSARTPAGLPAHPEPHLRLVSLLESDAHVPPAATERSTVARQAGGG